MDYDQIMRCQRDAATERVPRRHAADLTQK